MQPLDYPRKKRKSRLPALIILILLLAGAGGALYYYGPGLYYQYSGDAILRLQKRSETFESRYLSGKYPRKELYALIESTRKIMEILKAENPAQARLQYYEGLFDYYEFLLRIPLTPSPLLDLTGKGFLPTDTTFKDLPPRSIPGLSLQISTRMRRALALDPGLKEKRLAKMLIAYGDLFYTGRTDPYLLSLIEDNEEDPPLPPFFRPEERWIRLALYSLMGEKDKLLTIANGIREEIAQKKVEAGESGGMDPRAEETLSEAELSLILCHGYFHGKAYLESLFLARKIKNDPDLPLKLRVEAARMEGEVFLIQRGPRVARFFFQEALKLSGGRNSYIEARIEQLGP